VGIGGRLIRSRCHKYSVAELVNRLVPIKVNAYEFNGNTASPVCRKSALKSVPDTFLDAKPVGLVLEKNTPGPFFTGGHSADEADVGGAVGDFGGGLWALGASAIETAG
jgi:hypothetical protein